METRHPLPGSAQRDESLANKSTRLSPRSILFNLYYSLEMHLLHAQTDGNICWKIDRDDPALFELPGTVDWLLVNPLLYGELNLSLPTYHGFFSWQTPGISFGWTNGVVLVSESQKTFESVKSDVMASAGPKILGLLSTLRHLSGHATVPHGDNA